MSERQTQSGRSDAELRLEVEFERKAHSPGHGSTATRTRQAGQLEICPSCDRDLVYPVDWAPAGALRWSVALRCPQCEWRGGGIYGQDVVDRFDEVLDDGTQALLDDLELLTRANMESQVEGFATALRDNLILPEDF